MKNAIIVAAALIFGSVMTRCGPSSQPKAPESSTPATVSNANIAGPALNTAAKTNDGDADDSRAGNTPGSGNLNTNKAKLADRDDIKSANRSGNADRVPSRGDADDYGRKDSDGDNDDR